MEESESHFKTIDSKLQHLAVCEQLFDQSVSPTPISAVIYPRIFPDVPHVDQQQFYYYFFVITKFYYFVH